MPRLVEDGSDPKLRDCHGCDRSPNTTSGEDALPQAVPLRAAFAVAAALRNLCASSRAVSASDS